MRHRPCRLLKIIMQHATVKSIQSRSSPPLQALVALERYDSHNIDASWWWWRWWWWHTIKMDMMAEYHCNHLSHIHHCFCMPGRMGYRESRGTPSSEVRTVPLRSTFDVLGVVVGAAYDDQILGSTAYEQLAWQAVQMWSYVRLILLKMLKYRKLQVWIAEEEGRVTYYAAH